MPIAFLIAFGPSYHDGRQKTAAATAMVRDTPAAHAFYGEWHRRWKQTLSLGIGEDQWSLNSASAMGIATIAILPDRDNWVTHSTAMRRGRARIFHFWAASYGDEIPANTLLRHLISRFQRDGTLDEATTECAARDNFPWMNNVRFKALARKRSLHPRGRTGCITRRTPYSPQTEVNDVRLTKTCRIFVEGGHSPFIERAFPPH